MERQKHRFQRIVCWMIPALIVLAAVPAFGQDKKNVNLSGFRIQVFPFPQSLAGIPMHISFNGTSETADPLPLKKSSPPGSGLISNEPQPPDDFNTHLSRFRAYLFQYLEVANPEPDTYSGTAIDSGIDFGPGSGKEDQGVSLKIQADISDKSGALIFVLKI